MCFITSRCSFDTKKGITHCGDRATAAHQSHKLEGVLGFDSQLRNQILWNSTQRYPARRKLLSGRSASRSISTTAPTSGGNGARSAAGISLARGRNYLGKITRCGDKHCPCGNRSQTTLKSACDQMGSARSNGSRHSRSSSDLRVLLEYTTRKSRRN